MSTRTDPHAGARLILRIALRFSDRPISLPKKTCGLWLIAHARFAAHSTRGTRLRKCTRTMSRSLRGKFVAGAVQRKPS